LCWGKSIIRADDKWTEEVLILLGVSGAACLESLQQGTWETLNNKKKLLCISQSVKSKKVVKGVGYAHSSDNAEDSKTSVQQRGITLTEVSIRRDGLRVDWET
jgi:hypothetical protein